MKALIIIYLFLLCVQRVFSVVFSDYHYLSVFFQQFSGVFLPVFAYYSFCGGKYLSREDLKIKPAHIPLVLLSGFAMQFSGSVINYPFHMLFNYFKLPIPPSIEVPFGIELFLYIFLICIVPAVFEEVLFRKLSFQIISRYNMKAAVFVSAFIFSAIHFNLYSFVSLFVAGLIMSYIVCKGFSLIYAILFHFSLNFSGIILEYITKNEVVLRIIDDYFLVFSLVSVVVIAAFIQFIKKGEKYDE